MEKILIMGLPGAGKTFLAKKMIYVLESHNKKLCWFNADEVREMYNDWDFSEEGRIRQSLRMRDLADHNKHVDYVICDFVAPMQSMRDNFEADWVIWVDTISKGRYADTNALFQQPLSYDFRVTEQDADKWAKLISDHITNNKKIHNEQPA